MTRVKFYQNKGQCTGFEASGHSGYGEEGTDIICAAISALTTNTINSLEELAGEKMSVRQEEQTGFLRCDFESSLQEKSVFLIESMVFNLENLSREYGKKYLQVKFEEV